MGSDHDGELKSIDASPGALVWVRRRNGSWWPGRVVGLDELPPKCLIPPRSGTPIKLLGREDGSMDWYNLEKSKRVKAFRCGEYDDCIERAKASAVRSSKKPASAGKYVRREDAILHALELENACFSNGGEISSEKIYLGGATDISLAVKSKNMHGINKLPGYMARKLNMLEENVAQELSQSVVSFEQPSNFTAAAVQFMPKKKWKTPNDSEDDAAEGIKRMRDLQEIGLGVTPKNKHDGQVHMKVPREIGHPESASLNEDFDNVISGISPINSCKDSSSSLKRKRSHISQAYEKMRRKNRRRPLAKVCEGTRVIIPTYCDWHGEFGGQSSFQEVALNRPRTTKATLRNTDLSAVSNSSLNSSGTSCEEASMHECDNNCNAAANGIHSHSEMKDSELSSMLDFIDNDCFDGFLDVPLLMGDSIDGDFRQILESSASGKPKHATEKQLCTQDGLILPSVEGLAENGFHDTATQFNHVNQRTDKKNSEQYSNGKKDSKYTGLSRGSDPESFIDSDSQFLSSLKGKMQKDKLLVFDRKVGNSSFDEPLASDNRGRWVKCGSISHARDNRTSFTVNVPVSNIPSHRLFPRCQFRPPSCSKYQASKPVRSMLLDAPLYDVELNVQASYHGPRAPLVSLVSKLNGKAIVGHHISVEVLEDGVTGSLLTRDDCLPTTSNTDLLSNKRGNTIGKFQQKEYASQSDYNTRVKNSDRVSIMSSLKRKLPKNKKLGFSPRKIRKLSSITVDRRDKEINRKPVAGKMRGPAVTCIPLRVVFSRINEALSCPARPANGS